MGEHLPRALAENVPPPPTHLSPRPRSHPRGLTPGCTASRSPPLTASGFAGARHRTRRGGSFFCLFPLDNTGIIAGGAA